MDRTGLQILHVAERCQIFYHNMPSNKQEQFQAVARRSHKLRSMKQCHWVDISLSLPCTSNYFWVSL
jgi:hypothetical protein